MREHSVTASWQTWDGTHAEAFTLGWENGAWTAEGVVSGADVHYVVRLSEDWQVRQFLLFRDLPEPDLWLVTDGSGRWAEMNGDLRTELHGCALVDLDCSAFTTGLAARLAGADGTVRVARVDPETLGVMALELRFETAPDGWLLDGEQVTVDDDHLVLEHQGRFRRIG